MSTAMATGTTAICPAATSRPKHRACDECRTRKLACTKEPDGCSRCLREGIDCHYSPQKPMGRPRKRPLDEPNGESAAGAPAVRNTMTDVAADTPELDFSFLGHMATEDAQSYPQTSQEKPFSWAFGYAGNSLGDVGFDTVPQHTPSFSPSNIDPSLFISEPPGAEQVPNLSPNSATTPESIDSSSALPPPSPGCAHTAALYLSLDSMQRLPEGVEEGIRHARKATKTAYDVVYCPVCSFKIEPPHSAGSEGIMRNFQNLMLLAALIPSIVHAYQRILETVDQEVKKAVAERRRLVFNLAGFGGVLFGDEVVGRRCGCTSTSLLNHREMEPAMWRLTTRALLRADIYGLSGTKTEVADGSPLYIGLKDIVLQMEQKSKARHAVVDALIESGAWPEPSCGFKMHAKGETPTCQRVIAIAKASIESLVIP
ncbi:hypothetical protein GGS23DRAFT_601140 [Durotheca rogersii]|uniref:uncharacterized protein n=1 Tax=Durotheca rogersii TaxID=419775 RepID=UPI00221ED2AA|nr:uncharacterized protein GGS23DRAFT_601586 [Durotheca rogersii]XP_051367444.1 uncharacterized protein GGS23DRAFT_601140 [Durotheca rogersii]KAI5854517.1 hypothetical protein GGS23DRAFT_601586 [Durotheca rogersii]KAI5856661.1 hypothetical protein GGS23DRAFT_601140 [Durotheca rogersii]